MKQHKILMKIGVLSGLLLGSGAITAAEQIENGDFELGLKSWAQSGSYNSGTYPGAVQSDVEAISGNTFLYVNFDELLKGAKGRFQDITLPAPSGTRLQVSTDLRTQNFFCQDDVSNFNGAQIRLQGFAKPALGSCADGSTNIIQQRWPVVRSHSDVWTTLTSEREQAWPSTVECISVRVLGLGCTGRMEVDNISVTTLPPETISTGKLPADDLGITPYPKVVTDAGTRSLVTNTAYLDLRDADTRAVNLLKRKLADRGITLVDEQTRTADTLVVRLVNVQSRGMTRYNDQFNDGTTLPCGDVRRAQGYVLEARENVGTGTEVTIAGAGTAGQFYGVQTLDKLLPAVGELVWNGKLVDWPSYRYRGLVGGARSALDTTAKHRRNMIMLVGDAGWVNDGTDFDLNLSNYIEDCTAQHVNCVFGDSPVARVYKRQNSQLFSYSDNKADVVARYVRLHEAGVRTFYLNFDDINTARNGKQDKLTSDNDRAVYPDGIGQAHYAYGKMISDRLALLDKETGDQSVLLFTPMYYLRGSNEYGNNGTAYLAAISALPTSNVEIINTGAWSEQRHAQVTLDYGRAPAIWDNFVDRYNNTQSNHIPPAQLETMPGLANVTEYYIFPMGAKHHPWNNMAWDVLSDFLWNGDNYDPELAALRAMSAP